MNPLLATTDLLQSDREELKEGKQNDNENGIHELQSDREELKEHPAEHRCF